MKVVQREKLRNAVEIHIAAFPSIHLRVSDRKKAQRYYNAIQDVVYNGGDHTEAENALAWACGFTIIDDGE